MGHTQLAPNPQESPTLLNNKFSTQVARISAASSRVRTKLEYKSQESPPLERERERERARSSITNSKGVFIDHLIQTSPTDLLHQKAPPFVQSSSFRAHTGHSLIEASSRKPKKRKPKPKPETRFNRLLFVAVDVKLLGQIRPIEWMV